MASGSKRVHSRIDRLSGLPDGILHHILSFLDTKSSVKTCVLSRRWISLWKYVPVLNFKHSFFESHSRFKRYVNQALSLRSDSSRVTRVTVDVRVEHGMDLLDRITKYAASHGVEELLIICCSKFLKPVGLVSSCYQSLKVLELEQVDIDKTDVGLFSGFQLLESLTLTHCNFAFSEDAAHNDPFANFLKLETLKLIRCFYPRHIPGAPALIVTGPKLLSLEIVWPSFDRLQINAPKLQSLTLNYEISYATVIEVSKSNLSSLSRANITLFRVVHNYVGDSNGTVMQLLVEQCANLFKILHNVQALDLRVGSFKSLTEICDSPEHQSSPFKRLKSLDLKCPGGGPSSVPNNVIRYFLGSSLDGKHFKIGKLCYI